MRTREVKLPVLMIALLALTFLGLDGVLLVIVKVLERATPNMRANCAPQVPRLSAFPTPQSETLAGLEKMPALTPSAKEKYYDHACTG